jgi:hypothetical protein
VVVPLLGAHDVDRFFLSIDALREDVTLGPEHSPG